MPVAVIACSAFQGSVAATPSELLILASSPIHVDGINCVGPIAPPYPPGCGQDTGVVRQSRPSAVIICSNGTVSRGTFIVPENGVPVFFPFPSPVSRLVIKHCPTFFPRSDSCDKIAKISAGRTPVMREAVFAFSYAVPKGIAPPPPASPNSSVRICAAVFCFSATTARYALSCPLVAARS